MDWKIALVQHPMYFLIKEDCMCAERTPPWGAPEIGVYIERIRENLAVLRKYPELKVGFEWSGLELEQLAQDAPDVFQDMLELARQGRTTFYNGTYSQPHLQTLSAEANFRQFEFGARVYNGLCGHQVLTYAHQESSLNEQTPQLLQAFGIRYMAMPDFLTTLVLEGGELVYHGREGTMFVQGSEFVQWRGLDGTTVATYLAEPPHKKIKDWLAYREIKGLLHVPPIVVDIPDLIAIDNDWLAERSQADFVLLDEALPERLQQAPPRFPGRIYTNWSYLEGICAEELSRANWLAERSALQAEALNAMALALSGRAADSTDPIWKTILTTQHHDIYCFCGPDIRRKSIGWLREAQQQADQLAQAAANAILPQVSRVPAAADQLVLFNTVPHPTLSPAVVTVPYQHPAIFDADGQEVPSESTPAGPNSATVRFTSKLNAFGYASYTVQANGQPTSEEALDGPLSFENQFYQATVRPDGTFASLKVKPTGVELLNTDKAGGNQLAAQDSAGLGLRHEGTYDVSRPWPKWEPVGRGPELRWEPTAPTRVIRSRLGVTLSTVGQMGRQVQANAIVRFYHRLPWIEVAWDFNFDQASIGSFFDDDTKLRVAWPLACRGPIQHDLSFGVTSSLEDRPFFPASWVDISDGENGLAYFHSGTLKHWVTDGTLINLFAWGEDTDAIGNRLDMVRWPKTFDQRLNGRHTIRAGVYPHPGNWRSADVVGVARSFVYPPLVLLKPDDAGRLPASLELFSLPGPELVATAVKVEADQVMCRLYSISSQAEEVKVSLNKLKPVGLNTLRGDPVNHLQPFQIGHLRFAVE